jgi:hypothetical protein
MKIDIQKLFAKKRFSIVAIVFGALLLFGCGSSGGGGGDDDGGGEPTPLTFNLYDPDYYTAGFGKTASNLGGQAVFTNAAPQSVSGSYSVQTEVQEEFEGQPAIPVVISQTLDSATDTMTTYYTTDDDPEPIKSVRTSDGFTWTPTAIRLLPATGEIGDSGSLTSYTGEGDGADEDGGTLTETWELMEPASAVDGQADLVITSVVKNSTNTTLYTEELTLTIDETGDYQSIQIITTYPDPGPTITLSGDFD